jgi:AAA family ATP:ADP antiporter
MARVSMACALLIFLPIGGAYRGSVLRRTAAPAVGRPALASLARIRLAADGDLVRTAAALPTLARRSAPPQLQAAAASGDAEEDSGPLAKLASMLPPKKELKKVLPLGLMFFFILFNYTILRDTKDVLVVTAKGSGAEIIPFLKTYVNLPGAIGFTVLYSKLTNKYSREQVFYGVLTTFVAFFALFAFVIYPNQAFLHPHAFIDALAAALPAGFAAPLAIIRNWTFAVFYTMAELWGSVVVSLMFWGFANEVSTVSEAKKYYPLFGLGANVALIFSGLYVRYVSGIRRAMVAAGSTADPWGMSLRLLMGAVVVGGAAIMSCFRYIQTSVLTDPECMDQVAVKKAKTKTSMGLGESAKYLANSKYIRSLATLVIAYGMSINIVEVSWKSKLKQQFPNPNDYSEFMGAFSAATGSVTLGMMLLSRQIFAKLGWGFAALVTPSVIACTGGLFFALLLFSNQLLPLVAALGTTPLMLAVVVGALQNIFSKSAKYSLFDPCKEMAYIPLDAEQKTKGKAAVDVIGNPLGKSGGSLLQQAMIFSVGSLAASTPYLAGCLFVIIAVWLRAARSLNTQFTAAMAEEGAEA